MSDLPRVHATGLKVWRAVLLELLRREREGEKPPSVLALANALSRSHHAVSTQLLAMRTAKFVSYASQMGPVGTEVELTTQGRIVARLLALPPE